MRKNWTQAEDDLIRASVQTMTYEQIGTLLGRSQSSVAHRAYTQGIKHPASRYRTLAREPLPSMKPEQLGYLAGLIDGEGSIGLYRCRHYRRPGLFRLQPTVSISGTDPNLADYLKETLNAAYHSRTRAMKNSRPTWQLCWAGYRCLPVLQQVEPWLIIKRDQAKLLIEYLENRLNSSFPTQRYSTRDMEIYQELKGLNRLGLSGWKYANPPSSSTT